MGVQAKWTLAGHRLGQSGDTCPPPGAGAPWWPLSFSWVTCTFGIVGCSICPSEFLERPKAMWEGPRQTRSPDPGSYLMNVNPRTNCFTFWVADLH